MVDTRMIDALHYAKLEFLVRGLKSPLKFTVHEDDFLRLHWEISSLGLSPALGDRIPHSPSAHMASIVYEGVTIEKAAGAEKVQSNATD